MEKYFFEAFEGLERLAPGSKDSTIKAASLVDDKNKKMKILDVGCGNGIHTLLLAKLFPNAEIIAIDNYAPYIEELNKNAEIQELSNRLVGKCMSMFEMDFASHTFDIIWAEGSIYIAGFKEGLKDWKKYLKKDGYLICSEISWLTDNPAQESYSFWKEAYPEIDTIDNKIKQINDFGYNLINHYILPKSDWLDNYYNPLQANLDLMKDKYVKNKEVIKVIEMIQFEIDMYRKYSDDYSYVFYVMQIL